MKGSFVALVVVKGSFVTPGGTSASTTSSGSRGTGGAAHAAAVVAPLDLGTEVARWWGVRTAGEIVTAA